MSTYNWIEIRKYLENQFKSSSDRFDQWKPDADVHQALEMVDQCTDGEHEWDDFSLQYNYEDEKWQATFLRSDMYMGSSSETGYHKDPAKAVCLAVLFTKKDEITEFRHGEEDELG